MEAGCSKHAVILPLTGFAWSFKISVFIFLNSFFAALALSPFPPVLTAAFGPSALRVSLIIFITSIPSSSAFFALVTMPVWSELMSWCNRCCRLIFNFAVVAVGGDTVEITEALDGDGKEGVTLMQSGMFINGNDVTATDF
jgi:hypothetical protein